MKLRAAVTIVLLCALVAACGGGGGSRLSQSEYRARVADLGKQANAAQSTAQQALNAKSVPQLQARLRAFADAVDRIGDEVDRLKPPKNAEAANAELARGEHDSATEIRDALPSLSKFSTPAQAVSSLSALGGRGGHEIDDALAKLKKLGYTKGS